MSITATIKKVFFRPKQDIDMTEGNIWKHIIVFSLPLLLGSVFQQLYNTVDTWVLGRYVSDQAFSAVGAVAPIINMMIGFFTGLASGAGVVISQYYGAKRYNRVSAAVRTAAFITMFCAVALSVFGLLTIPYMLNMMNMPEPMFPEAKSYLTIYFAGMVGLMVYNVGAGILRAIGDSKKPFYFLACSAIINIVLDLLFVLVFDMGVEGVAYATVIAQGCSAVLVVITLLSHKGCIRLTSPYLNFDTSILRKMLILGLPASLQLSISSFSNIFVQSYINFFGDTVMGGWTVYAKLDALMIVPMDAIALAATTFVGHNLGNKNPVRAKKGVRISLVLAILITFVVVLPVIIFAPSVVRFFNGNPEIIRYGTMFLRYIAPFYVPACVITVYAGAITGSGNSRTTMIFTLSSLVIFRHIYLFVIANFISNTPINIAMSYPAGWIFATLLYLVYYHKIGFKGGSLKLD